MKIKRLGQHAHPAYTGKNYELDKLVWTEKYSVFKLYMLVLFITHFKFRHNYYWSCIIFSPPGKNLHKDMLYTIGKIRVLKFIKSTGSILQSWAKHFTY